MLGNRPTGGVATAGQRHPLYYTDHCSLCETDAGAVHRTRGHGAVLAKILAADSYNGECEAPCDSRCEVVAQRTSEETVGTCVHTPGAVGCST